MQDTVCDLADLQERIYAAVNNVTPQMLENTYVEIEYRLDISLAINGKHVDVYGTQDKRNSQFSFYVAIWFIYRFVLFLKLTLFAHS